MIIRPNLSHQRTSNLNSRNKNTHPKYLIIHCSHNIHIHSNHSQCQIHHHHCNHSMNIRHILNYIVMIDHRNCKNRIAVSGLNWERFK